MSYRTREGKTATFVASFVFVIVIAAFAAAGYFLFGGEPASEEDIYPWITSDHAAENGMLDGSFYSGEKNEAGYISYKIAGEITIDPEDGTGDFKIENSGKNTCLIKVSITIGDEVIYSTDYLKPNQHIDGDYLTVIPSAGTHDAKAVFEGFDPNSEASLGSAVEDIKITVMP